MKDGQILRIFIRHGVGIFFILTLIGLIIVVNGANLWLPYGNDEIYYKYIADNFTVDYISHQYDTISNTKPPSFLLLAKVLNNADYLTTRIFIIFLIGINTILIYKITKNKLAIVYPLFPVILDVIYLNAETIEIFFVLLSIYYANRSGWFIGLATIFRPYALAYTLLVPNKQKLNVIIVGSIFAVILLVIGLFFPYLHQVTGYIPNNGGEAGMFMLPPLLLIMLFIMGGSNKKMIGYVLLSLIPIIFIRQFAHYFLPAFTYLYIGYLLNMNSDLKEIKQNAESYRELFK